MNTLRGGRRDVRRWPARRTRWFVPATLVLIGVAAAGIFTAPRAGVDLAESGADPLRPAEAAPATPTVDTTTSTSVAVAPVTAPTETTTPVPVVTTVLDVAAADLESFFVAVEGGDLVGAFDHLAPEHQVAVGGFVPFESLWRAPARIEHDPAECVTDEDGFDCTITFRTYAAEGACAAAVYSYRLRPTGTRHSIVEERPIAQRSCPAMVTTTTASSG